MTRTHVLALMVGAGLVAGCNTSPAPVDSAAVQRVLDSALAAHAQLFIDKNIDGLMDSYSSSAVVYSSNVEPLRGSAAIKSFLTGFLQANVKTLSYRSEELAVYGDSAWQIISFQVTVQPPGANAPIPDHGSAFALWVRDSAGVWRIHRDIFNSSVPLPAPAK